MIKKKPGNKMPSMRLICFMIWVGLTAPLLLKSQEGVDTSLLSLQKKNAIDLYYQSLQLQSGLYNGSEYVPYVNLLKEGYPYFDTTTMVNGSVFYDGMLYKDVPLLYDIIRDELIIQHFNKVFYVQLIRSKIEGFSFLDHSFVHLGQDSTKKGNVSNGFYEVLYDGNIKLYAKRVKTIQESIPEMTVERKVYSNNRYFIFKNDTYNEVYSQASVLNLLEDKKTDLKQALKKQHVKFRKQREYAIRLMVQQYDALKP